MNENHYTLKELKLVNKNRSGNHYYHPQNKSVYYLDKFKNISVITHVQYDFVAVLNKFFCKYRHYDEKAVFYKQYPVKNADFDSFQLLYDKIAKDKNRVYYGQQVITDADSSSFEVLINSYDNRVFVGKDRYRIYKLSKKTEGETSFFSKTLKPITGADASAFEFIGRFWAKDQRQILCRLKPVKEIDAGTFKVLFSDGKNEWAKDINNLYNGKDCKIYRDITGSAFTVLNEFWGKDDRSVFSFYTKSILCEADAASFEVIGFDNQAQDKNYFYAIDENGEISKTGK